MTTLLVLNHAPYDGTDVTWNALRLADKLLAEGVEEAWYGVVVALLEGAVEVEKIKSFLLGQPPAESGLATVHVSDNVVFHSINSLAVWRAAAVGGSEESMVATSVSRSAAESSRMRDTVLSPSVSL